jgi:hypothetical protein
MDLLVQSVNVPAAPALITPADGASGITTSSLSFRWDGVEKVFIARAAYFEADGIDGVFCLSNTGECALPPWLADLGADFALRPATSYTWWVSSDYAAANMDAVVDPVSPVRLLNVLWFFEPELADGMTIMGDSAKRTFTTP